MLVLARKKDEVIWIGDDIKLVVVQAENGKARIGIEAPKGITILRDEVKERVKNEQAA